MSQYCMLVLPSSPNTNCCHPRQLDPMPAPAHTLVSKNSVLICSV